MRIERYQNDRHFVWYFYIGTSDRTPYSLEGLDLSLEAKVGLTRIPITDYTVSGNTVDLVFRGRDQKRPGPIILTLYINRGQDGMVAIDALAGLMSPNSTPGAPAPGGVETSSGEIVSFLGEWVDDRLIPASIARTSELSDFVTRTVTDLVNYYSKEETYSRQEIEALVGGIRLIPVPVLPEASAATMGSLYLVPSERPRVQNEKDEYITTRSGEEGNYTYEWEQIGSTAIDLSGYVTTAALNQALAEYVTTADLTLLLSGKQDTIEDLQSIRSGAAAGATAYQKPSTGIPATDLAGAVQASLGKADTALQQSDLEPIKEVIPDAATPQNKLADKAFVNSSIATATATFRGAYNLVTDLSLTTAATQAQIATALAGAVSTADNNDYAFVQVPTADVTPTEIAQVERYKYNGSAWAFEYALNNSGFTASQWAALNSGITSGLVSKLSALPTNSELTILLAGKQDKIDSTHKLDYSLVDNTPTIPDAVEANPTVPSGTTPSDLTGLKVGNGYYKVPEAQSDLSDLDDVDGTPTNGQVLTFDGTEGKWTPADPAGGGDDEATEVTAAALNDLNSRMFEKKNLVDTYDQVVAGNHEKAATSFALYKFYRDQLTNEEIIATALCDLKAIGALATAIAPLYERGTRTFAVDDCCIYDSQFWRCITAVPTPEPFDSTKWVKTSLFEEMIRKFNAL